MYNDDELLLQNDRPTNVLSKIRGLELVTFIKYVQKLYSLIDLSPGQF